MPFANMKTNFFVRWFRHRDLMIRDQDKISFCSLSAKRQGAFFLILCAAIAWSVFTSFYFLNYNSAFTRKSDDLEKLQAEYTDLKDKMAFFADHLDTMIEQMEDNQQVFEALKQDISPNATGDSKIRKIDPNKLSASIETKKNSTEELQISMDRLKNETVLVREHLSEMIKGRSAEKNDGRLAFHRVLFQRDIAAAETKALQEKVKNLENLISGMQETQILAFRKMAFLADDGINVIENELSDIKQSLAGTGMGMETLLRRIRRDKETVGIGGPFIPAPMSKPQHDLNISLVSLNQRLDRWYDLTTLQNSLPLGTPVERIRVTSAFGARGDPFQGSPARHEAVDLGGMIGEPVYATAPGKVVRTGSWGWYGNMVEIDHGLGFRTRYAHMEKVFVTKGETVRAGDRIGTLGNTGRSTGPHLHYEIRIKGIPVDPMKFIKAKKNVFKS